MFTGLVEEIGTMEGSVNGEKSMKLTLKASKILENIKIGDSISTNGVCLTVTSFTNNTFTVDVMPETMRKTNLGKLRPGSLVNLERALKVNDRLGGHIVSGHVDGTGVIRDFKVEDNATWVIIETNVEVIKYIIPKGSIAIDGTSLTVVEVVDNFLRVSIIPITKEETILLKKKVGDEVNLECDIVGKYIERFLTFKEVKEDTINMNFLEENGFL
ncbi:riboflavin synthase [Sedimentibacter acidaminivorans]|jgi:riboflavin synthase|uniref:Riboflavin synthase n=1 Tax=Sedimentibacter acidaminivorans TaxID=913099 RepID=A0ABS4GH76_9FIRM|nr:riboflavin synthase [Sedimentibacter acidaminivorans]MBP1927034.1 riboflavin synthase [Sedimentibacter acidaminivorans]